MIQKQLRNNYENLWIVLEIQERLVTLMAINGKPNKGLSHWAIKLCIQSISIYIFHWYYSLLKQRYYSFGYYKDKTGRKHF